MPKRLRTPAPAIRAPRRPRASSTGTRPEAQEAAAPTRTTTVTLAAPGGVSVTIETGKALQQAAMQWSWVVRNRSRWATLTASQVDQSARARTQLQQLGVSANDLDGLSAGGIVQVGIPFVDEATAWEARVFPWEYVLSSASRGRQGKRPWVVRRLMMDGPAAPARQAKPASALIVESAPGDLGRLFSFQSERRLARSSLTGVEVDLITDPTPTQLHARVKGSDPRLIHLAGVDTHQAALLLGLDDPDHDGYLMSDDRGAALQVPAEELASSLATDHGPRLVTCNFWNSAARTAPMTVALGAEAAIGFQDQVDDALAELFFATFYRTWAEHDWRTAEAFEATLRALKAGGASLKGTGVVFWSRRDALADRTESPAAAASPDAPTTARGAVQLPSLVSTGRRKPAAVAPQDAVWVEARPLERLNYALLHNNRGMFDTFRIRKQVDEVVRGVAVEVVLYVGGDSYPYRATFDMHDPVIDLRDKVRVPLTSAVFRAFRESVQSVLYVGVSIAGVTIFQDTFRVTLVPVEEWSNDNSSGAWLASFVLPRDPAVSTVIDSAFSAVRILRDDGISAFDGYQSVDQNRADPYDMVDRQVEAVWSALSFEFGLRYINPPPTYSSHSQRLRTPSEVLRTRSGTCIDLALLMAACLEWIEIYPVIFLLQGHAFPGYWRGQELHADFVKVGATGAEAPLTATTGQEGVQAAPSEQVPWLLRTGKDGKGPVHAEMLAHLKRPDLIVLETVGLTTARPFLSAADEGRDHLADGFISMVDIQIARESDVTPLPLDIG